MQDTAVKINLPSLKTISNYRLFIILFKVMYVVNVRTDTREYIVVHAGHLDLFLTRSKKLGRKTS